jgi:ABC-type branched-subunit amino acid transport system substrate-binding protein
VKSSPFLYYRGRPERVQSTRWETMRRLLLLSFFLLAGCTARTPDCTDPIGCIELDADSPLVLGVIAATSGPEASAGNRLLQQVRQAVELQEELLGHPLELIVEAADCSGTEAARAATRLASDADLVLVIGPACPADQEIAAPYLEAAGIARLSPLTRSESGASLAGLAFDAIQAVAIQVDSDRLWIPRQALIDRLVALP